MITPPCCRHADADYFAAYKHAVIVVYNTLYFHYAIDHADGTTV